VNSAYTVVASRHTPGLVWTISFCGDVASLYLSVLGEEITNSVLDIYGHGERQDDAMIHSQQDTSTPAKV
jgi:hypothetical protein